MLLDIHIYDHIVQYYNIHIYGHYLAKVGGLGVQRQQWCMLPLKKQVSV